LYASKNIIRVIKTKRVRWGGHVPLMEGVGNSYRNLVGKPKEKRILADLGVYVKII